jgi:hypothetical protein
MTVQDIIKASMRNLGVIASGETPSTAELADALSTLQSMLRLWASKQINVFATIDESVTLTGGQASYSWGTSGNITTSRPHEILNAYITDTSGYDAPVDIIDMYSYNQITSKTTTGRPFEIYYKPSYPLGYIYLYPTPDVSYTLHLNTLKPFTETSSFDLITSTFNFPPNYEEPIISNLAVRLAPQYGKTISAELAAIAGNSYDTLINLNANNQLRAAKLNLPISNNSTYDINLG